MDTENRNTVETQEEQTQDTQQTFTQEDVNRIVQKRVAKYSDYEELKAKAAKLDEIEEANKTELEKATERADSLQKQIDGLMAAEKIRDMHDKVSKETGVPANLLTADTEEECIKQAEEIKAFARPKGYPAVKDAGEVQGSSKGTAKQQFIEWMNQQI